MKSSGKTVPIVWCLLAAALFGASTPACKAILGDVGPVTLAGLLYLGAALGVLPYSFRGGSAELRRDRRQVVRLAGAVIFGGALGPVLLLIGLSMSRAASVSLWLNLETVATAAIGYAFFREHVDRRTWLAIALVLAAGIILAMPSEAGTVLGALFVGLACVCWGLDNSLTAIIDGYTPAQMTLAKGLIAGTVNLAIGLAVEESVRSWPVLGLALIIGIFSYGLSIVLYIRGAQLLGATRSQMIFATAPFIGVSLSWTALGESAQPVQMVAGLIMAVGLVILLTERHEHVHMHEADTHVHSHRHDDDHHAHYHPRHPVWLHHTHAHTHQRLEHSHDHEPDLHHRHEHRRQV